MPSSARRRKFFSPSARKTVSHCVRPTPSTETQLQEEALAAQTVCRWAPQHHIHAQPSITFREIGYCSLSEAAFGVLLEYFIPGFEVVPGYTFQVPIGGGRSVDFCINGVLIEYHQVRLFPSRGKLGDFSSPEELREYRRLLSRVRGDPRKRRLLDHITRQRLVSNYTAKRRAQLDQSPFFSHCELVVATSREDFFHQVIRRFALVVVPGESEFLKMFWDLVQLIAQENGVRDSGAAG